LKKVFIIIILIFISLYILLCGIFYFNQEKILFHPKVLRKDHKFDFNSKYIEYNIKTSDGFSLNSILFKTDSSKSKGVIFYLHGNSGSIEEWGNVSKTYLDLNYDVFMVDYRGYGKSEGIICNQKQIFEDINLCYNFIKSKYSEDKIIVLGYSLGTGLASYISSVNKPKLLILQAPYFSIKKMMKDYYPFLIPQILKYPFETNLYLKSCSMPIVIIHGDKDEVIPYSNAILLSKDLKTEHTFITLQGQKHNAITENTEYKDHIKIILN
jgi:uncharacterized protein